MNMGNESRGTDSLEDLFRHASPRERIPEAEEDSIRREIRAEWRAMTARRRRKRLLLATAATATLAVISAGLLLRSGPEPAAVQVATVERLTGAQTGLEPQAVIRTGEELNTASGVAAALRWAGGESVRIAELTSLRIVSKTRIELTRGRVYVDSDFRRGHDELTISTPWGLVEPIGTRYMAEITSNGTVVSVRSGRVQLGNDDRSETAAAGQQLALQEDGQYRRQSVPVYGSQWAWAEDLTPRDERDERSMFEFLAWAARETGRELVYETAEAQARAEQSSVSGQIDRAPMEALEVVMQSSDLSYRIEEGRIVVALNRNE